MPGLYRDELEELDTSQINSNEQFHERFESQFFSGKHIHKISNNLEDNWSRSRRLMKSQPSSKYGKDRKDSRESSRSNQHHRSKSTSSCYRCGLNHRNKPCPAKEKTGNYCKKIGHFEKKCRNKSNKVGVTISQVMDTSTNTRKAPTDKILIKSGKRTLGESEALLDYGADISIADLYFLKQMVIKRKDLKNPIDTKTWAANQSKLKSCGTIKFKMRFEGNEVDEGIVIVQGDLIPPLIVA